MTLDERTIVTIDAELNALREIVGAMKEAPPEAHVRMLVYLVGRFVPREELRRFLAQFRSQADTL